MKLHDQFQEVITSDDITPTAFTIKASRKAFQILSSGLYTDKVKAIIRELGCNAYDAHVANGNPQQPFHVHLPTLFEPYFSITDYGTGLAHEDVLELYTTYFQSTKTDSNEFTGALGLGSKSPFCYTDCFTVESRHNGVISAYTAYLDTSGTPSISLGSTCETDSPNGLTISFPVDPKDKDIFETKAREVFRYFNTIPTNNLDNKPFHHFTTHEKYVEHIDDNGERYWIDASSSGLHVLMGNVLYPLEPSGGDELDLKSEIYVILEVPIGKVDVAASREALSLDNYTTQPYVSKRLSDIWGDFVRGAQEELDAFSNLFEASVHRYSSNFRSRNSGILKAMTYRGTKFQQIIDLHDGDSDEAGFKVEEVPYGQVRRVFWEKSTLDVGVANLIIHVADAGLSKIRSRLENSVQSSATNYLVTVTDRNKWEKVVNNIGFRSVILELRDVLPPKNENSLKLEKGEVNKICKLRQVTRSKYKVEPVSYPLEEGTHILYAPLIGGKIELLNKRYNPSELPSFFHEYLKNLPNNTKFRLVKKLDVTQLSIDYTWQLFSEHIYEYHQDVLNKGAEHDFALGLARNRWRLPAVLRQEGITDKLKEVLPIYHPLTKLVSYDKSLIVEANKVLQVRQLLGVETSDSGLTLVEDQLHECNVRYPLLSSIDYQCLPDVFANYIISVDQVGMPS